MSLNFVIDQAVNVSIILSATGAPVTGLTFADITAYASKNGASPILVSLAGAITELSSVNMPGIYSVQLPSSLVNTLGELVVHFEGGTFDTYLLRAFVYDGVFNEINTNTSSNLSQSQSNGTTLGTLSTAVSNVQTDVGTINTTVGATDTKVDAIQGAGFDTGTDSLAALKADFEARIPEEVVRRSDLVNGTGNITPPTDIGIWDVLGDGTASISDMSLDIQRVLGLSQENYRVTGQTYDANDNLISGIITLYPSASDLNSNTNVSATYVISASYDTSNRLIAYQVAKQ